VLSGLQKLKRIAPRTKNYERNRCRLVLATENDFAPSKLEFMPMHLEQKNTVVYPHAKLKNDIFTFGWKFRFAVGTVGGFNEFASVG
jgi:hypothetical protein